jgi:transposase
VGKKRSRRNEALYNVIQQNEIPMLFKFLPSAVYAVLDKENIWHGMGRPSFPIYDILVCLLVKEYFKLSFRRCIGLLVLSNASGLIKVRIPCFKTLCNYQKNGEIQFYLERLIELTSNVFSTIENELASDSTGISTTCYSSWYSIRVCKKSMKRDHLMVHITVGTRSNIVVCLDVCNKRGKDNIIFRSHVQKASKNFDVDDWSGDSAYLSRENCTAVAEIGARPWFKPKSNITSASKGSPAWKKMVYEFRDHPAESMDKYHKRSNVESTNSAKKRKFRSFVRGRLDTSRRNEESLSWVDFNFSLMPRAVYEFDLEPTFIQRSR